MVVLEENGCLYAAMGVEKGVDAAAIRKAYLRLAVTCHPDKHPDDEAAKERFQTLQKVYGVLSDPEKRKVYDATGSIDDAEQLTSQAFKDMYEHYRGLFAKVTPKDIEAYELQFRGGPEEQEQVLRYYSQFEGDMDQAFEWIMCSYPERDSHRFMDMVGAAIKAKQVKHYPAFAKWAKRVGALQRPSDPLAPPKRSKKQKENDQALVAMIQSRHKNAFGSALDSIAAKYGVSAEQDTPDDAAFEAAAARLAARKASGGKTGGSKGTAGRSSGKSGGVSKKKAGKA